MSADDREAPRTARLAYRTILASVTLGAVAWGGVLLSALLVAGGGCENGPCPEPGSYRIWTILIELAGLAAIGVAVALRPHGTLTAGAIRRFLLSLVPAAALFSWWLPRFLELLRNG